LSELKYVMENKHFMSLLQTLSEGEINFAPTFKYNRGTNDYDTRVEPAYCDRIMFSRADRMQVLEYTDAPVMFSDHRPVYATFQVHTQMV